MFAASRSVLCSNYVFIHIYHLPFFITPDPSSRSLIDVYIKSCFFSLRLYFSLLARAFACLIDAQCSKLDSNVSPVEKQQISEMRSFHDNNKLQIR